MQIAIKYSVTNKLSGEIKQWIRFAALKDDLYESVMHVKLSEGLPDYFEVQLLEIN